MSIKGRIAITGRPGVGKSSLIGQVVARLRPQGVRVGGMLTQEIRVCGHRVGFSLTDLASGETATLAHIHGKRGPTVGKYTVDLDALTQVGVQAILRSLVEADLTVIDEIAPMELLAEPFVPAVETALAGDSALLIATHAHVSHPIVHRVRQELTLYRVKMGNRDRLVEEIAAQYAGCSPSGPASDPMPTEDSGPSPGPD